MVKPARPRMRRPVALAMSCMSVIVVATSLKASERPAPPTALGAASLVTHAAASPTSGSLPATEAPIQLATTSVRQAVTVNGGAYDTAYGPVLVQITVRAGRITAAHALQYPSSGGRDQEINSWAIPTLDQEAIDLQSAQIDTVSGATYTSDGYRSSLQSAIDAAHKAGAL